MTERRNPIEDDYIVFSEFGVDQRDGKPVILIVSVIVFSTGSASHSVRKSIQSAPSTNDCQV